MEASFVSAEQRSSKAKTVAIVALAVVGTLAACFLVFNQAAVSTSLDDRTAAYDQYQTWKSKNGFTFGGAEDQVRFENYYVNYQIVKDHYINKKDATYTLGMTPFAAMSLEEFTATHLGLAPRRNLIGQVRFTYLDTTNLSDSVDWRAKGAVTGIKNQGQCGSCWAFSTTGSIEGAHFLKTGKLVSYSEQDLVDCSGDYGNEGCEGGLMDDAFQYVVAKGIALEADYPYTGVDGNCKSRVTRNKVISGHEDVVKNNTDQLKAAVAKQPVSVAIEADTNTFQLYTGGVINDKDCGIKLDHGVLAVGYDKESFIVKNSWGDSWGEAGYVRIGFADHAGICGIQQMPSYPIAK